MSKPFADLVTSLKAFGNQQTQLNTPQFRFLQGHVYLNRCATLIAIPQATLVKKNTRFVLNLKIFTHVFWG